MPTREQALALRLGVALTRTDHIEAVRLVGDAAFDMLDRVSPRPLFVRDGQMLPTVFLNADGTPFADVYVCVDDLDYLLLSEGPTGPELVAWLREHAPGIEVELVDLSASHTVLGVHGPYAWELVGDLVGPEVVGVPYLTSFRVDDYDAIGFRAGKTGEFAYEFLVPRERADALWQAMVAAGADYDAQEISLASLDLASLENGFYCIRHAGMQGLTPVALQLLWRVVWDREYPGADGVRAHRGRGERIAWFRAPAGTALESGAEVRVDGAVVGRVLHAAKSVLLDAVVGLALLPHDAAWPAIAIDVGAPAETVAPPLIDSRSLHIDAQRHAYAGRHGDDFPALFDDGP